MDWLEFSTCSDRLNRNIVAPIFHFLDTTTSLSIYLNLGRRTLLHRRDQHQHSCRSQISAGQNVSDNIRTHRMQRFPGFCLKCGTKHPKMYGKSIKTMRQRQGRNTRSESQNGESKIRKLRRLRRRTRSRSMKRLAASVHVSQLFAVTALFQFSFSFRATRISTSFHLNVHLRFSIVSVPISPDGLPASKATATRKTKRGTKSSRKKNANLKAPTDDQPRVKRSRKSTQTSMHTEAETTMNARMGENNLFPMRIGGISSGFGVSNVGLQPMMGLGSPGDRPIGMMAPNSNLSGFLRGLTTEQQLMLLRGTMAPNPASMNLHDVGQTTTPFQLQGLSGSIMNTNQQQYGETLHEPTTVIIVSLR